MEKLRIDKWLWAARFYKTRTLATEEIEKGRVTVNQLDVKPAREVKAGDTITLRQRVVTRTLTVLGVSNQRGGAPAAQLLYEETQESIALRGQLAEQRRIHQEPAAALEHGRPTKRDRRDIDKASGKGKGNDKSWDSRWSASAD
jgi:ribosome-associated heat shock protein Hsp15